MSTRHLYIHVPFCARRCTYCDFSIAVRSRVPVAGYLDALGREAALAGVAPAPGALAADPAPGAGGVAPSPGVAERAASPGLAHRLAESDTLYLGGGTPSKLGGEGVARLAALLGVDPARPPGEFTLEANPEDVSAASAGAWAAAGVNRISIGAQSFDDTVLAWMHRTHDAARIGEAVAAARRAGIAGVSLDLIFALPEAIARDWRRDLDRALALEPDHVSLYGLTLEPATPLFRRAARGAPAAAPAADSRYAEEYLFAHERLAGEGYAFYEVSNAARPGREAVHNRAYWRREPYLGLGPSAHSFDGAARWWNERAYEAWRRKLAAGRSAVAGREILGEPERRLEAIYLGLRTSDGVPLPEPCPPALRATLDRWVAAGWAALSPRRVRLTPAGWLRLDELVTTF